MEFEMRRLLQHAEVTDWRRQFRPATGYERRQKDVIALESGQPLPSQRDDDLLIRHQEGILERDLGAAAGLVGGIQTNAVLAGRESLTVRVFPVPGDVGLSLSGEGEHADRL